MTCTTCGRENPPHLTFCQECGQRLGPRIAPPTPPIGLGGSGLPDRDFYAANPHRLATSLGGAAAQNPVAQRPSAPAPTNQANPGGPARPCRICATPNGPNLRYCTSCGSTLEPVVTAAGSAPRMVEPGPTAPAPAPAYGAPIAPAPAPFAATATPYGNNPAPAPQPFGGQAPLPAPAPSPAGGGVPPIAPMRVVDLGGGPRPSNEGPRMCGRCRGVVDPNAQFCKFCGAPLAEAAPPAAAAPAPAPAPYVAPAARAAEPLMAHERLSLPRTNGQQPPPMRAPTVPMTASPLEQQTPMGEITPAPPPALPPPLPPPPLPPPIAAPPPLPPPPPLAPPAARPATTPPPPPAHAAAPAPAAPAAARTVTRGRLVVIAKSGADGPSYPFGDTLDVGRLEGQIIVGEDPYLSPRHVRIAWTGSKLVLRDLASTNGVYIRLVAARDTNAQNAGKAGRGAPANDAQVPGEVAVPLHDQDLILVGQQVLRFEIVSPGTHGEGGFGPATEHGTLLFGSPAAPRYARLSQRTVEGVTRDVYYVRKVETVLGRESGDVVFTEDPFLSRRHAAIRVLGRDGAPLPPGAKASADAISFALVDLGSSNGSFLRIRNEIELVPGDHFRVGQQLFRVDFSSSSGSG
jgi:pSer/pThr/pTyr-binding forkhead associated (FHA) protein